MSRGLLSNQEFIEALQHPLDLDDPVAVFRHMLERLDDEVVVYPTENYVYFQFAAAGTTVAGSFTLGVRDRDLGVVGFGYTVARDRHRDPFARLQGGGASLSTADGVVVTRLGESRYSITLGDRTVVFSLNEAGLGPPPSGLLDDDEVHVGPCFDESGLRFFLVFNETEQWMYWILDEEAPVTDTFAPLADGLVVGRRTEYAFFVDEERGRMILVGVEGFNVLQNNWYDGPFDQLPDNLVASGRIELQPFIEAAYPNTRGRIDRYGNFLDEPGARVAVAPYLVYFSTDELTGMLTGCRAASATRSEFLASITRQVFEIPPEIERRYATEAF